MNTTGFPPDNFPAGTSVRSETTMLRCSAAAASAQPCIPGTVVRSAVRTGGGVAADDPRVPTPPPVRTALVNGPGPECEVRRRMARGNLFLTFPRRQFSTGRPVRTETTMLRRSAAAAPAQPCIPGAVVRSAHPTSRRVAANDPRVSTRRDVGWALVNGPGPEYEVRRPGARGFYCRLLSAP